MNMLFVIDIGNTNITVGLYEGNRLKHTYRLTTKMKRTSDEYGFMMTNFMNDAGVASGDVEDVIIASVVPKVMHSFRNCIRKYLHKEPIIIGPGYAPASRCRWRIPRRSARTASSTVPVLTMSMAAQR